MVNNFKLWIGGTSLIVIFSALLCAPTNKGLPLLLAIYDIHNIMKLSGTEKENINVTTIPTRYSFASVASQEIAITAIESSNKEWHGNAIDLAMIQSHKPQVAQAISAGSGTNCEIYASAQSFDEDTGANYKLSQAIPDVRMRWNYILLHERAHCFWNGAVEMENYIKKNFPEKNVYVSRPYFLAQYLGEAYADAYAILTLHVAYPEQAELLAEEIARWRYETTTPGIIHRTPATAISTINYIKKTKNLIFKDYAEIHEVAILSSMTGLYYWLKEQKISDEEAISQTLSIAPITGLRITALKDKDNHYYFKSQ
jgi:hypothetical protein